MDSAVYNEFGHRPARDFAANGVKAGNSDGFGGVINDNINPGGHLEGANVTAVAADDASFHLVVGQGDNWDGDIRNVIAGDPLYGLGDEFSGFIFSIFFGSILNLPHDSSHILTSLSLHRIQ